MLKHIIKTTQASHKSIPGMNQFQKMKLFLDMKNMSNKYISKIPKKYA